MYKKTTDILKDFFELEYAAEGSDGRTSDAMSVNMEPWEQFSNDLQIEGWIPPATDLFLRSIGKLVLQAQVQGTESTRCLRVPSTPIRRAQCSESVARSPRFPGDATVQRPRRGRGNTDDYIDHPTSTQAQ